MDVCQLFPLLDPVLSYPFHDIVIRSMSALLPRSHRCSHCWGEKRNQAMNLEIFIVRGSAEQCFYAWTEKGHSLFKHTEMSPRPLGKQGQERQEIMKESGG